ncbi:hypothetical protein CGI87_15660 [Vibrio parahaemolyticus]|nr:hypothetical protein CGI87_15660 [Vibrio parahaemolyticus]
MSDHIFNELIKQNYLLIDGHGARITKKSQKRGSPLDRYRTEILFFRKEQQCSYQDIANWLSEYKHIHRSHTQIASKIKQWENDHAPTEIQPEDKI